jgi:hypothetical protein
MASLRKPTVSVPKDMRHATAWDLAAATFAPAPRPGAWGQATTARSTSQPSTTVGMLRSLARRSRGPAAQRLRGVSHLKRRPSMCKRAYSLKALGVGTRVQKREWCASGHCYPLEAEPVRGRVVFFELRLPSPRGGDRDYGHFGLLGSYSVSFSTTGGAVRRGEPWRSASCSPGLSRWCPA